MFETYDHLSPLISVVIPVYNAEKFIEETILTVLNQTYINWELILVDDCSTDNSVNIIKQFENNKIHLYQLNANSGAALARNYGIEKSNGDFICFLDADDLWDKNKLEKQLDFMINNNYAFTFTGYEFANIDGEPNGKKVSVPKKINYKNALKNTIISTITVMFNMNLLSKEDIYMPNVESEDTATWWKILKNHDYAYGLNEILSFYRRGMKSLSSNKFRNLKQVWHLYRKQEKLNFFESTCYFICYIKNAIVKRL